MDSRNSLYRSRSRSRSRSHSKENDKSRHYKNKNKVQMENMENMSQKKYGLKEEEEQDEMMQKTYSFDFKQYRGLRTFHIVQESKDRKSYSHNLKFFEYLKNTSTGPYHVEIHAGAAGSGKSSCCNARILSIPYFYHHKNRVRDIKSFFSSYKEGFQSKSDLKSHTKGIWATPVKSPEGTFVICDMEGLGSNNYEQTQNLQALLNIGFMSSSSFCFHIARRLDNPSVEQLKLLERLVNDFQKMSKLALPKLFLFIHDVIDQEGYQIKDSEAFYEFVKGDYKIELTHLRNNLNITLLDFPPREVMGTEKDFSSYLDLKKSNYLGNLCQFHDCIRKNKLFLKAKTDQSCSNTFFQASEYQKLFESLMQSKESLEKFFAESIQDEMKIKLKPLITQFEQKVQKLSSIENSLEFKRQFINEEKNFRQLVDTTFKQIYNVDFNKFPSLGTDFTKSISAIETSTEESIKKTQEEKKKTLEELEKKKQGQQAICDALSKKIKIFGGSDHCPGCKCCFTTTSCRPHDSEYYYVKGHPGGIIAICGSGTGDTNCLDYQNSKFRCKKCGYSESGSWSTSLPNHGSCSESSCTIF